MIRVAQVTQGAFVPSKKKALSTGSRSKAGRSLQLAMAAASVANENGATDIVVMDMTTLSPNFDYFVIATGTSQRQLRAIASEINHKLEGDLRDQRMHVDGYDNSSWVVLDYGTVVVHLFDQSTRMFYSLEALWGDAKRVDLAAQLPDVGWR
jgi:ribosome-associated protein